MRKSTDIIQVALILSAIDTALQAFAPFRRIGGGLLGGLPTSALGQNVGIICSNKVVNKWVFVIIASVFAIAGLFPQLSAVLSAIPQPVIGGATVGVFGTITMNGVRMFTREGLTQRTTTIVGTSVVFGLGIRMASGCLAGEGMPTWVSTVMRRQCRNPHRHHGHRAQPDPSADAGRGSAHRCRQGCRCGSGLAREQEVTNSVLFVGGHIASSADVTRRQAALQRVCPVGKIRLTAAQVVKSWAVSLFRLRGRCLNGVDPSFYASDAA